jgi:DSBA-like thioredoxin domain
MSRRAYTNFPPPLCGAVGLRPLCYALPALRRSPHRSPVITGIGLAIGLAVGLAATAAAIAPAGADAGHVQRVEHQPADELPALGPRDAPVQVELFFSPGISNSRLPYQLVTELWRNHPTRIRVVFRVLSRQGQVHLPAAALEAAAQGKFFELMAAVHTRLRGTQRDQILALAESVGVDPERLVAAWKDSRHNDAFEINERRRQRMRARQVPEVLFSGKLASRPVTVLGSTEMETAYREAYARARDALDRGVAREELAAYLDAAAIADRPPMVLSLGPADEGPEEDGRSENAMALMSPPPDLRGLPSRWKPAGEARAEGSQEESAAAAPRGLPVLLACNPLSAQCYRYLHMAESAADVFQDRVRVVWAPMFQLRSRDAATVARVADAVLCANQLGVGWNALDVVTLQANRRHGRILDADRLIDDLISEADLDGAALASCMAVNAGAAVRRVAELRRAGLSVSPTVVVGGRMYPGSVSDVAALQGLIEDELASGWLGEASLDGAVDRAAAPVPQR